MNPEPIELKNGQIWEQKKFPYFKILTVMLGHVDEELMFCRLGFHSDRVPLLMNDADGKWMFNTDETLQKLIDLNYTLVGRGTVVELDSHQEPGFPAYGVYSPKDILESVCLDPEGAKIEAQLLSKTCPEEAMMENKHGGLGHYIKPGRFIEEDNHEP